MLETDILELIKQGEGPKLEFKQDGVRPESLAKEIVAFANMNGGRILVGVRDDGGISGIQRKNFQEWLMDVVIGRHVSPPLFADYREVAVGDSKVAVIEVPMGTTKPYDLTRGDRSDVYVRYGNVCRRADKAQVARLFQTGGQLVAEKFPVHGSTLDELDKLRYLHYFREILKNDEAIDDGFLKNRHFLVGEGDQLLCSYFAYALFGLAPGTRLPKARVHVTVFPGVDKDYEMTLDEMLDVPYVALHNHLGTMRQPAHEQVVEVLKPFISKERVVNRVRERVWDYPPAAIGEAVVNGLIHRDWTRHEQVHAVAYEDRLVIESPGPLPNGLTIEGIKTGVRLIRNEECVRIFRDYGYIEGQGMGIRRKIIPLCLEHSGREPDFESTPLYFRVTMHKKSGG